MGGRRHLVVVLPGIGGSVLERADATGVVWDAGFGSVRRLALAAERLSLREVCDVRPVGLIRSWVPLPGWTVIRGYDRLMAAVGGLPGAVVDTGNPDRRVPDANAVAFPYDFRKGVAEAAELLDADVAARLRLLGGEHQPGRVVVVAHSLGGLVARYWLGPLGGWRVCRALITLGTPHRGAPKALAWMVDGVRAGGRVWQGTTELIREWPSTAELLPRYPAIWDELAQVALYPGQLPISWLRPLARRAFGMHEDIERGCDQIPQSGPELVPRLGWSHATLDAAFWDGARLRVTKKPPSWLEAPGWEHDFGDGTVPAVSALPIEAGNRAVSSSGMRVHERHSGLVTASRMLEEITARLEDYEGRPVPAPGRLAYRGAEERGAAIGLDIDNAYLPGEPIGLKVSLHGASGDVRDVAVGVALRPVDGPAAAGVGARRRARLAWDAAELCFSGELIADWPGVYDVVVAAEAVPGAGDLAVTESVAVIEA